MEGTVETLIYKNDDSGWAVARVETDHGEVVITGQMPYLGAGESIVAYGHHVTHPEYGPQFNVETYERVLPSTAAGIYEYLASRTVKGIGPKTAMAIVERFGDQTFEVLASMPEQLAQVKGITSKKAREIQQSFLQNNAMRALLDFFVRWGLPMW